MTAPAKPSPETSVELPAEIAPRQLPWDVLTLLDCLQARARETCVFNTREASQSEQATRVAVEAAIFRYSGQRSHGAKAVKELAESRAEVERLSNMAAGMFWAGGNFNDQTAKEIVALGLDVRSQLVAATAELAAIKAASEDSTEYVLAQVNRELRAEIARLQERNRLIEDTQHINDVLLSVQLAAATEQIAKLEALVDEVLDGHLAPADGGWLARAKALRSAVKNSEGTPSS